MSCETCQIDPSLPTLDINLIGPESNNESCDNLGIMAGKNFVARTIFTHKSVIARNMLPSADMATAYTLNSMETK